MTSKVRKAVEAEAKKVRIEFEFEGKEYSVPSELSAKALDAIEQNKVSTAVRAFLGDKAYDDFLSDDPSIETLGKLFEACLDAQGVDRGESTD